MTKLELTRRLETLALQLIDQREAEIIIPPNAPRPGFWFGGGNLARSLDGTYYLCGRYRNAGDSRTGIDAGERGAELAIFKADGLSDQWQKVLSLSKEDLSTTDHEVVSIEGCSLHFDDGGVELFVSTEKLAPYPEHVADYQKPGTGVWSIDRLVANEVSSLASSKLYPLLDSREPSMLHVKDPVSFDRADGGTALLFCHHPYTWASSNTGVLYRPNGAADFVPLTTQMLHRGHAWDVAATRITSRLAVPMIGCLEGLEQISLYFYDGAECLRELEQNRHAVHRPRGHSCEEIGGLAWGSEDDFPLIERLSVDAPLFLSPYGTGCSRYVSTLVMEEGILATWQQSQPDGSQPLVAHFLPIAEVAAILS